MSVHDDRVTFRIPLSCTSLSFGFVKMLKNPTKLDMVGVFIYPDELLVLGIAPLPQCLFGGLNALLRGSLPSCSFPFCVCVSGELPGRANGN